MKDAYEDIIHIPHHRSARRPHMNIRDRAAQFSPFAALTGFDSALEEAGRLTDSRTELEEFGRSLLDRKLAQLLEQKTDQPNITVTYFCPDQRKAGGSYKEANGKLRKIDLYRNLLILENGKEIPITEILDFSFEE